MAVEPEKETGGGGELSTLLEFLNQVADPRKARGVRYGLGAVLGLSVLAFICGRASLSGVSRFGRDHKRLLPGLGIARKTSPSVAALSRILGAVDAGDLQTALARWVAGLVRRAGEKRREGARIASVDGKGVRASGIHMLNVFVHDVEQVVWSAPVGRKANEIVAFKSALSGLLEHYPFLQLITGDAMYAGTPLCELLIANGRHYMFQIKADQPQLLEKMELVFAPQLARKPSPASLTGEKKGRVCRGAGGMGG